MAVKFYSGKSAPAGSYVMGIYDNSDVADALGYHTEDGGVVYGRVFVSPVLDNGGVILYDAANPQNVSVASVLSHEVAELFCDPYVNSWVDGPKLHQGGTYALEVADPVESDSYIVAVGKKQVSVSNFVLPQWFDSQSSGQKYDYMGNLKAPFAMTPGGYMVIRATPGTEAQVFGEKYPEWRKDSKKSPLSRTKKRCTAK